jgi:D-alanyl-D-alanine carboxypeptidase (penicillin-binding protein 5/6)
VAVLLAVFTVSGIVVAKRLGIPPPLAVVRSVMPSSGLVPGSAPAITWPAGVQSAIAIPVLGVTAKSGGQVAQPIASLTKLMTAHLVLTDHPLSVGEQGASITITASDVALYETDLESDQTNIEVAAGEVLTEDQLLEGMLVHSASNFADLLAIWDAGSVAAFVTKMNASAAPLGMTQTQYADASGFSTQSVSTAADQVKVASVDIVNPVFDQIINMPAVTLPIVGTVGTTTPLLGNDNVVGVKSGFTSAAGGCDVLALREDIHGVPVEVLAVTVGDHMGADVITNAGLQALSIARLAISSVRDVEVASRGQQLAVASVSGHSVPVVAASELSVLAWPGQRVTESVQITRHPRAGTPAGWRLGSVTFRVGHEKLQTALRTGKRLPSLTLLQRVF